MLSLGFLIRSIGFIVSFVDGHLCPRAVADELSPGVGPCCGTLVAYAFYRFIKILEYEMANPGQDHSAEEAEHAATMKRADAFV